MNILLINGPNLNLLGKREPEKYGKMTLEAIVKRLKGKISKADQILDFQSNSEGDIISFLQKEGGGCDYIIINAGSLTHTSIGIRDTLLAIAKPFIEVHLTNVFARERFRRKSYLSDIAVGVISGMGHYSYDLALEYILKKDP